MFEHFLEEVGLNEKEAKVYLELLGVDYSSPLELAKKTKIKRPTVYTILQSLEEKGLVSETTVGKKTRYQAEPPDKLETFIERKKLSLEDSRRVLKEVLPQLKSMRKGEGSRPVVRFFEGKEGAMSANKTVLDRFGKSGEDKVTYILYPKDTVEDLFSEHERVGFSKKRISSGVKSKAIYTTNRLKRQSDKMGDRVKIDSNKYPISCDIMIYGNMVRIVLLGKKISGVFIESEDVAETMKSLFKLAFDGAKEKGPDG